MIIPNLQLLPSFLFLCRQQRAFPFYHCYQRPPRTRGKAPQGAETRGADHLSSPLTPSLSNYHHPSSDLCNHRPFFFSVEPLSDTTQTFSTASFSTNTTFNFWSFNDDREHRSFSLESPPPLTVVSHHHNSTIAEPELRSYRAECHSLTTIQHHCNR